MTTRKTQIQCVNNGEKIDTESQSSARHETAVSEENGLLAPPPITQSDNAQPPSPKNAIVDAVAKWSADTPRALSNLTEVRLDASETIVVPFTTSVGEVAVHYVDYPSVRSYLRCNGDGCLLCRIGRQAEKRDLLPIFHAVDGRIAILPISPSIRPGALRPQILPVLRQLKEGKRVLLIICRPDRGRYSVTMQPLAEGIDDGAAQIAEFLQAFATGSVDLASVFPQLSNPELAAVPEIATALKIRGIQP
jgi:hypothetical protein